MYIKITDMIVLKCIINAIYKTSDYKWHMFFSKNSQSFLVLFNLQLLLLFEILKSNQNQN